MTETPSMIPQTPDRAWRSGSAQFLFWLVVALTAGFDLVTKWCAFRNLNEDEVWTVIPNLLQFRKIWNPGAVFGIGAGMRWVFIGASIVAMIFIFQLFAQSRKNQWGFHFLLAITLGGAIGNMYDRVVFQKVRDFIHLSISVRGTELWPWVFNIGDVALVVGVCGLLIGWLLGKFEIGSSVPVARPIAPDTNE